MIALVFALLLETTAMYTEVEGFCSISVSRGTNIRVKNKRFDLMYHAIGGLKEAPYIGDSANELYVDDVPTAVSRGFGQGLERKEKYIFLLMKLLNMNSYRMNLFTIAVFAVAFILVSLLFNSLYSGRHKLFLFSSMIAVFLVVSLIIPLHKGLAKTTMLKVYGDDGKSFTLEGVLLESKKSGELVYDGSLIPDREFSGTMAYNARTNVTNINYGLDGGVRALGFPNRGSLVIFEHKAEGFISKYPISAMYRLKGKELEEINEEIRPGQSLLIKLKVDDFDSGLKSVATNIGIAKEFWCYIE